MAKGSAALFVIGMSCYWPLLRRNGLHTLFSGHQLVSPDELVLTCVYLVFGLLCALAIVAARATTSTVLRQKPRWLLGFAGGWLAVKLLAFANIPFLAEALGLADAALFSLGFVFLSVAWGDYSVRTAGPKTATYLILSFFVGFVLQQATAFSPMVTTAFFLIAPVLSLGCWFLLPAPEDGRAYNLSLTSLRSLPLGLITLLVLFLLVGSLFRGFYAMPLSQVGESDQLLQNAITMALTLALLLIGMRLPERSRLVNIAWVVVAVAFFAGLFLVALLNPQEHGIGTSITVMARTCMTLLFWITLVNASKRSDASPVLSFGLLFVLSDIASSAIGYLVPGFIPAVRSIGASNSLGIALACAFMLLVASMVFLSSQVIRSAGAKAAPDSGQAPTDAAWGIDAVAEAAGLTPRETEVARYLARGYSQKKISEMLVVSDGTTQSHIKSIYRKLDVHSRQELIDLAEASR